MIVTKKGILGNFKTENFGLYELGWGHGLGALKLFLKIGFDWSKSFDTTLKSSLENYECDGITWYHLRHFVMHTIL